MGRLRLAGVVVVLAGAAMAATGGPAVAREKQYRLPETDLKAPIIWGATCDGPDGTGLSFGGQDQQAEDGGAPTRVKEGGAWKDIRADLRAANPLQKMRDRVWAVRGRQKNVTARARAAYFKGASSADARQHLAADVADAQSAVLKDVERILRDLEGLAGLGAYESGQAARAARALAVAGGKVGPLPAAGQGGLSADTVKAMAAAQVALEQAAEALDAEPGPRALSPIVFEPKTGLYVLFGGDHLDYLTGDTWVFDAKARRWISRHPPGAPPPRANHMLRTTGDGKVSLAGGYTYASNTDYCGGQYQDVGDGEWTYDVAADAWTGPGTAGPPEARVYRAGPFHPDFYLQGDPPDAAATGRRLADLPANTWVDMKPPYVPRQNRDWGTVRLDADRDQILVWSGGHSAHGGSDVLHYHLATNRWELPFPVEFPLGQLYSNTSYPDGFNFNRRPWVTGHTYLSYEYDPLLRQMLFVGRPRHFYVYDPDAADWVGRREKPKGMVYGDCFYNLTLCATPRGTMAWSQGGRLFRFDAKDKAWQPLEVRGQLPEPAVDYSTMVYDSKRDRLLVFRTGYGRPYDGQVHAVDLKEMAVRTLDPGNMAAAGRRPFSIDRACYHPPSDLVLMCSLLPGDADGFQRTPAYDVAGNRWVSLRIACETDREKKPLAPAAVRHSCGLVWDAQRQLLWGVNTNRVSVYALRLDAGGAQVAAME